MALSSLLLSVAALAAAAHGLDNGLGRTPQMGYNSWYDVTCKLDEATMRQTIDTMVKLGLVDLGYNYFNLDDCWSGGRYPNGSQYTSKPEFPSGTLKPLADYAHSKGMLFGTYTDRGTNTCAGRPGALNHEKIDAETYASWGVDYLKEDSCHASGDHDTAFAEYGAMRDALNATGRKIFFSLCGWNNWYAPPGKTLGNSWRIGPDDTNWGGVLKNIDINADLHQYAGPGGWNDPCLLLAETAAGPQRMTEQQTRAQFSMWAIMASPLLISANLRNMSAMNLATYTNKEVIAVNQDPQGKQGWRASGAPLSSQGGLQATACDAGDPAQHWTFGSPKANYVFNKASNKCLNLDDCGNSVILFECVTTGGTCCGASCYDNMMFELQANHSLTSPNKPGSCAQVAPDGSVSMAGCTGASSQTWAYNSSSTTLAVGAGQCLSSKTAAAGNVWVRPLVGGKWAVVFINAGSTPRDVSCDAACLAQMDLRPGDTVTVRDLWAHSESTKTLGAAWVASGLAAQGGSVMFTVSK